MRQADQVSLDAVQWVSVPDDNTRMLNVQAGELDCAIFVPFSQIETLKQDANLNVMLDPSSREDHIIVNSAHGDLGKVEVRQALDMAIDKQALVQDEDRLGFFGILLCCERSSCQRRSTQHGEYRR